jgi:hypothetical protein
VFPHLELPLQRVGEGQVVEVTRELGWRSRVQAKLVELEPPGWARELGDPPTSVRGRRVWSTSVLSVRLPVTAAPASDRAFAGGHARPCPDK